eukprot:6734741-Prymnesium_polylepis.1
MAGLGSGLGGVVLGRLRLPATPRSYSLSIAPTRLRRRNTVFAEFSGISLKKRVGNGVEAPLGLLASQ